MDYDAALAHFKKADRTLHRAAKTVPPLEPWKQKNRKQLFASLAESVVSQQLSVKAADTIWLRLKAIAGGEVTPDSILATPLPKLRKAGLSASKAKTLKEIAKAVRGGFDLLALKERTPEEAIASLTTIWGVGPWTAEMFLMFALRHPDIFSARDLGLVRSMEALYNLRNPTIPELEAIARSWSPYRTIACRILWRVRDQKKA
jgi:DNA-3-methyladenine glycosylase II